MPTYGQLADQFLNRFAERNEEAFTHHALHDLSPAYAMRMKFLHYLEGRGFIAAVGQADITDQYTLTVEGGVFQANGGFAAEDRRIGWDMLWTKVKVGGTIAYSILVLAVAVWAVLAEIG